MLLFIDNIFRFVQAGSEVSALLGRMPSQVGYQPTLESEMGQLQERITSTRKGSVTSVQAIYVPADDLTDPAPASVFAHLNATTTLSRAISEKGIYPAVDPLDSTSTILKPEIVGEEHFNVANEVKEVLQRYRELQDIIAILGIDELSDEDKRRSCSARARSSASCRQPFHVAEQFTGTPGEYVPIAETVRSFREILDGKHDDLPESAFLLKGSIDDVVEAANKSGASKESDRGEEEREEARGRAEGERRRRRRGLMARTPFKVEVLTPEGEVFNDEVEMVSTRTTRRLDRRPGQPPAAAGMLDPTELRLYKSESDVVRFAQGEGYLQVAGDARARARRGGPRARRTSTRPTCRSACARPRRPPRRPRRAPRSSAAPSATRTAGRRSSTSPAAEAPASAGRDAGDRVAEDRGVGVDPRLHQPALAELIDPHVVHIHGRAVLGARLDVHRQDDLVTAVDEALWRGCELVEPAPQLAREPGDRRLRAAERSAVRDRIGHLEHAIGVQKLAHVRGLVLAPARKGLGEELDVRRTHVAIAGTAGEPCLSLCSLAGDRVRRPRGLAPGVAQLRGQVHVADEAQAGRGRLGRERARHALVVEHAEVPDHGLEAAAVAGRGDHRVGLDARAVGQRRRRSRRATRRRRRSRSAAP